MKPSIVDAASGVARRGLRLADDEDNDRGETVLDFAVDPVLLLELLGAPLADIVGRRVSRVVLDLGGVGELSGLGLGVILALRRAVAGYGGAVLVRSARPRVQELFRHTGLDVLFACDVAVGQG